MAESMCHWLKFCCRDVLDDAALEDDSKRLQGLLDWADNHVIVFYSLAGIFLGFQVRSCLHHSLQYEETPMTSPVAVIA